MGVWLNAARVASFPYLLDGATTLSPDPVSAGFSFPRAVSRYNARMTESKAIYWQWRVRLKPGASSPWFSNKTWKELRWRMTEAEAAEWGEKNDCEMQQVEDSGETREDYYGSGGYGGSVSPAPGKVQ